MGHVRRLVVFDLDGTLIDSRRDLADAANALILERGGAPLAEDAIVRMVGEGAALLVRRALTAAGLPVNARSVDRFLELYDERLLRTTVLYPGIAEALAAIQAHATLAVLTNKPLAHTERLLRELHVAPRFGTVIGGDGPWPRKPDPAALQHLMTRGGATQASTVLVGDSRVDLETARAAGTRICLARYGFGFQSIPRELAEAELTVDAARALPAAVSGLLDI